MQTSRKIRMHGWLDLGHRRGNVLNTRRKGGFCWKSRLLFVASRIGAARDTEERMQKRSEGMEPRFISWNVAATHTSDFSFPDAWDRKKIKAPPSRKPVVSSDVWSNVYTLADDWSRLKWPGEVKVVLLMVPKELRGGTYMTVDELAPHGDESVEFLVNDEFFYNAKDLDRD